MVATVDSNTLAELMTDIRKNIHIEDKLKKLLVIKK